MPRYEYQCDKCGELFEVSQKFADEPLSIHDACGGPVHRLISVPALQFKGSGWYVTDYAKSGAAPANNGPGKKDDGAAKPAATESTSSSSEKSSTETKPAS